MRLYKKYPVVGTKKILQTVGDNNGIPISKMRELYRVFVAYLKHRADDPNTLSMSFGLLGKAYFLVHPSSRTGRLKKDINDNKREKLLRTFEDIKDENNGHLNIPIYKYYGINRKNKKTGEKYTLKEIAKIQNEEFLNDNYKDAEKIEIRNKDN